MTHMRRKPVGWLFVAPALFLLLVFLVYPTLWTIRLSLYGGPGFVPTRFVAVRLRYSCRYDVHRTYCDYRRKRQDDNECSRHGHIPLLDFLRKLYMQASAHYSAKIAKYVPRECKILVQRKVSAPLSSEAASRAQQDTDAMLS